MHLSLFSSTIGIDGGDVCGRYADDACLIRSFVNAPTAVVGSHSKFPSSVIILINGNG